MTKETEDVLVQIHAAQWAISNAEKFRDEYREKVQHFQKLVDVYQAEADKNKQGLDQLELKLREVLAGLPSTIVVPPPAIGIEDQVGREG